eukprot:356874-Chlamydomonas_euryale.AAC.5
MLLAYSPHGDLLLVIVRNSTKGIRRGRAPCLLEGQGAFECAVCVCVWNPMVPMVRTRIRTVPTSLALFEERVPAFRVPFPPVSAPSTFHQKHINHAVRTALSARDPSC